MCIRDRALESIDLPERNSADFGISPIFASGTLQNAVSYTHLDVYKRQKLGRRNLCRKN